MIARRPGHLSQADRDAFKVLGLEEDPDSYDVQAIDGRWRTLRTQLHPDKPTGDAVKFDEARKAYNAARFYALEPKPCNECKGSGKVERTNRNPLLAPMLVNCSTCRGSGLR